MARRNIWQWLLFALLVLYLILISLRPVETEDVWWHLSAAKQIFTAGHFPHEDPFAFAGEKVHWIYTQWLGGCLYFFAERIGGLAGLRIFRVLIFLSIFAIFFRYAYKKIPFPPLILLIYLMSFGVSFRAFLRPDFFNFIFMQILLILLLQYDRFKERKYLLWVPAVGLAWFNFHLGSVVYGSLILFCFWFAQLVKIVNLRLDKASKPEERKKAVKEFGEMTLFFAGYYAAFLLNPYGLEGFVYAFRVFLDPKFIDFYKFNAFIAEQQPPIYLLSFSGIWFLVLVILAFFSLGKCQRNKLAHVILFLTSFFMFLYSDRGITWFVIASGYVIVENFSRAGQEKQSPPAILSQRWNLVSVLVALLLVFNIIHIFNRQALVDGKRVRQIFYAKDEYSPKKTIDFLAENHIRGRVFNFDRYGGAIIWHGYPGLQPFVDGRQSDKSHWEAYRRIVSDPQMFWPEFERKYGFDIALINEKEPFSRKILLYLLADPDWKLVNIDGFSVLFVRKEAENAARLKALPVVLNGAAFDWAKAKEIVDSPSVAGNFLPEAVKGYLFPEPFFDNRLEEGIVFYDLGFKAAGIERMMEVYQASHYQKSRYVLKLMLEGLEK